MLCQLFKVLKLFNVDSLSIDGNMAYSKRDEIVAQFHSSNSPRVLIFSKVGSAGLNLSIADRVIFFVNPFSLCLAQKLTDIFRC
jgi:SNF2 family DNA or RNA helicase